MIFCGVYALTQKLYRKGKENIIYKTDNGNNLDHVHHMEWINGIKGGYGSDAYKKITAPFEYSGPFTETVLMGNLAIRSYMSMGHLLIHLKIGIDFAKPRHISLPEMESLI